MPDAADILYQGSWLTVRAITLPGGGRPATDWHTSLDKRGRGQFLAACRALETALSAGRPPAGRAEKVKGSSEGVWEFRVTKKGSTPPHLRAFFVREQRTLWVASGITKQKNKLQSGDIARADSIVAKWRQTR